MKKLLLSLAVIGASAAYVVAESQTANQAPGEATAAADPALPDLTPRARPSALAPQPALAAPSPAAPPAPAVAATVPARPARPLTPTSSVANHNSIQVAEIAPPQIPGAPVTANDAAPDALPPLPRPRPADVSAPPAVQTVAASATGYSDGTFKGSSENAYYGRVQVSATIKGGQIVSVDVLQFPSDRRTSRYINGQALPILTQEVVQAQSARVDLVSGATLTSEAFVRSIRSALAGAGGSNA